MFGSKGTDTGMQAGRPHASSEGRFVTLMVASPILNRCVLTASYFTAYLLAPGQRPRTPQVTLGMGTLPDWSTYLLQANVRPPACHF